MNTERPAGNRKAATILCGIAAGLVTGTLARFIPFDRAEPDEAVEKAPAAAPAGQPIADAEVDALRARNSELVAEVERLKAEMAGPERKAGGENGDVAENAVPVESHSVSMKMVGPDGKVTTLTGEEAKKKSAELFSRIRKSKNVKIEALKDPEADTIGGIDTSWMNEDELAVHTRLQDLLKRKSEMRTQLVQNLMTGDKKSSSFDPSAMIKLEKELSEAYSQERDVLLQRTALDMGYSGEDASDFVSAMKEIYDATTPNNGIASHAVKMTASGSEGIPDMKIGTGMSFRSGMISGDNGK